MPEFGMDKIFSFKAFRRFPHKIHLQKGEPEKKVATGYVYVHKLSSGVYTVCLRRLSSSGCPCAYCEYTKPELKKFELHRTELGYRLLEFPCDQRDNATQSMIITIALSWVAPTKKLFENAKYKHPYAFGALRAMKVFPSHFIPHLKAYYNKWYDFSLAKFEEKFK